MIPAEERLRILTVATQQGIDHRFLAALRETENGRAGREFGVLIPGEETWDKQANDAARTIRHTVGRFWRALGEDGHPSAGDSWDDVAGRYSDVFIRYFSRGGVGYEGYCNLNAANDPTGLNKNHLSNLMAYYAQECA